MKIPNKFNQPVSLEVLAQGICACEENARRLIADAEVLIKSGGFLSAINLLRLAIEEMAKDHLLWQGATYGNQSSAEWEWLWDAFESHKEKLRAVEYEIHWASYQDKEEFHRRINILQNQREHCLYVHFDAQANKFFRPSELIPDAENLVMSQYKYALGLYQLFFPVGSQPMDEIIFALKETEENHRKKTGGQK